MIGKAVIPLNLLLVFVFSLTVVSTALGQRGPDDPVLVVVEPTDGSVLSSSRGNAVVHFSWTQAPNAASYNVSFYKLLFNRSADNYVPTRIHSAKVFTNSYDHDFAGNGSPTIIWKIVARNASGQVIPMSDGTNGTAHNFTFSGFGPTMEYIGSRVQNVGQKLTVPVFLDSSNNPLPPPPAPGRAPTTMKPKKTDSSSIGGGSCVKERRKLKRHVTGKKARRLMRKQRCEKGKKLKRVEQSPRVLAGEGTNPFSIFCYKEDEANPGQYSERSCPYGMSMTPEGSFSSGVLEPGRYLVEIRYQTPSGNTDSQMFWITIVGSEAFNGGAAGPLTFVDIYPEYAEPNGEPHQYISPRQGVISPENDELNPERVLDGVTSETRLGWMPQSAIGGSGEWVYTVILSTGGQQQPHLVERMYVLLADMPGSAIPLASDIQVQFTTKLNPDPSTSLTNVDWTTLTTGPMLGGSFPYSECSEGFSSGCPMMYSINAPATQVRLLGTHANERHFATFEVSFSGWRSGETDCNISSELEWRTRAFLDADNNGVPDNTTLVSIPTSVSGGCYGPGEELVGSGYVAPENAVYASLICPPDPNVMVDGECGPGYPNRNCYIPGDFNCDSIVDILDFGQFVSDYNRSDVAVLARYCRGRPNGALTPVGEDDFELLKRNFLKGCFGWPTHFPPISPVYIYGPIIVNP